jgi:hypothetical protein
MVMSSSSMKTTSIVTDGCPENWDKVRFVELLARPYSYERECLQSHSVGHHPCMMVLPLSTCCTAKTFQDYATEVLPYISSQLQYVVRLDIIWDVCIPGSLKADARSKRGKGVRRRVDPSSLIPGNWQAFLHIDDNKTELFSFLAIHEWLARMERYVILLYDRTGTQEHVNEARKQLFTQKGRAIDGLPPTQAALVQHIKRAAYQAQVPVIITAPELPSPSEWGWNRKAEGGWKVCWTTLPEATQACRELIRCGCKKGCRGRSSARRLLCSALLFVSVVDFTPPLPSPI